MIQTSMDVLREFPVRKSKQQKEKFRESVSAYAATLGYTYKVEEGSFGSMNIVLGDPQKAKYLVTAHYDTPAGMFLPNLITPCNFWTFLGYQILVTLIMLGIPAIPGVIVGMLTSYYPGYLVWYFGFLALYGLMMFGPANPNNANDNTSGVVTVLEIAANLPVDRRDSVCFVLFDLEEKGLIGSKSYAKIHKETVQNQIVLNLDCVGDGDELMIFPTKKLPLDADKMAFLRGMNHKEEEKSLTLHEKGFYVYNSDQKSFPYGAALGAFKRGKAGLYCDRIHTSRDTILDEKNVSILRDRIITVITG